MSFCHRGRGYPTEETARMSKAAHREGSVVEQCRNRACAQWYVANAPMQPDVPQKQDETPEPAERKTAVRRRDTGPDARTRMLVYERDGWCCVCCGFSIIGHPHSIGHRQRRSQMGGHTPENLITLLGWGNGMTADDHHWRIDRRLNPRDEKYGYTVRSGLDPLLVPVMVATEAGLAEMWLTRDGRRTTERPEGAEAA